MRSGRSEEMTVLTFLFDVIAPYYLWLKALHIIAVITWMAGLLYLPRLYVYHCEVAPVSSESERFKLMEGRLLRIIMVPSILVVWLAGLVLAFAGGHFSEPWLHAKLLLVVVLSGIHGFLSGRARDFAGGTNRYSQRFYRVINEIPAVIMVVVVVLVVVKPF